MSDHTGQHVPTNVEVGMTDSDELVGWLRAQLDDDERLARTFEVREGEWRCQHCGGAMTSADRLDAHLFETGYREWGPGRVLAEVDAKRRIIDERRRQIDDDDPHVPLAGPILLQLLALPYADRRGYREEWRPGGVS